MESISITQELLDEVWRAQVDWTIKRLQDAKEWLSDDGYDYLDASLTLAQVLSGIYFNSDLNALDALLNTPMPEGWLTDPEHPQYVFWEEFERKTGFDHLASLAGGGIAPAIYDLNCPALLREE